MGTIDQWDDEEFEGSTKPQDHGVSLNLYREWRTPRYGNANPQRLNNPTWEWLVRTRKNAYVACTEFQEPSAMEFGPGWCFDRFGRSSTLLPDGRCIRVAGEHEDHYDPDFYIYNDVVVLHPDGRVDIFGYPPEIFPPTDFHSATLVQESLLLIGNLGYPQQRKPGFTQVAQLDVKSMAISMMPTTGCCPGWISSHEAELSEDGHSILVTGGKVQSENAELGLVENFDDWRLDLRSMQWERLTDRVREVWRFQRSDGECNNLWQMRSRLWIESMAGTEHYEMLMAGERNTGPPPDKAAVEDLYRPAVTHTVMPENEEEHHVWRVAIEGVMVRFAEHLRAVEMTVEGTLPSETVSLLVSNLTQKLSSLEKVPYEASRMR